VKVEKGMSVVAIGFFDGVHLGHQKILRGADVAVTFRNHPLTVLNAAKAPRLIMSPEDRVAAIKSCGVKDVLVFDFTSELAAFTPDAFIKNLLRDLRETSVSSCSAGGLSLRCGSNWRFGKNAAGTPDWLREHGISVEVVEAVEYEGEPISSTRIRECLSRGEIAAANAMMGRRLKVEGRRLKGKGEGVKLGYPTINLLLLSPTTSQLLPNSSQTSQLFPLGVYQVEVEGCRAIANYGLAPTFGEQAWKAPVLEVHLLDMAREGASDTMSAEFVKFIRAERKFVSTEELKKQIAEDIASIGGER